MSPQFSPTGNSRHSTVALIAVLMLGCTPAEAQPVSGQARAIDGDSLTVGKTEVRLFGIDAPEWAQQCSRNGKSWACGEEAAATLGALIDNQYVSCTSEGIDQHGRTLGRCMVGKSNVNSAMVLSGYATAYRHYSSDYVADEQQAKAGKRGLWSGSFSLPSDYRHSQERQTVRSKPQRSVSSVATASGGCVIKGNRGRNGWIYHLPGMPYYERTKAEEIFCTEAEAQASGYRRAK